MSFLTAGVAVFMALGSVVFTVGCSACDSNKASKPTAAGSASPSAAAPSASTAIETIPPERRNLPDRVALDANRLLENRSAAVAKLNAGRNLEEKGDTKSALEALQAARVGEFPGG